MKDLYHNIPGLKQTGVKLLWWQKQIWYFHSHAKFPVNLLNKVGREQR